MIAGFFAEDVLHAIVDEALGLARDAFGEDDEKELWPAEEFAGSLRVFDRQGLMEQIDRLLLAHRDPSCVYRVGDYHMLMLYEALEYWAALHNDSVAERHPTAKVGRFRVGRVDLGSILDSSFPDLDFLTDELLDASAEVKQAIGVRPETFAVVARLKPHPSELDMVVEERGTFRPAPGPRTGRVVEYPPRRAVKWFDQAHQRRSAIEGYEAE